MSRACVAAGMYTTNSEAAPRIVAKARKIRRDVVGGLRGELLRVVLVRGEQRERTAGVFHSGEQFFRSARGGARVG